jgi:hypothetical protein
MSPETASSYLNGSERLVGRITVAVDSRVVVTREE